MEKKNGGKIDCRVGVLGLKPSETDEGGETCLAIWIIQLCLFGGKRLECSETQTVLLCWVPLQEQVCSLGFKHLLVEKREGFHSCLVLLLLIRRALVSCVLNLSSLWKTACAAGHSKQWFSPRVPPPMPRGHAL